MDEGKQKINVLDCTVRDGSFRASEIFTSARVGSIIADLTSAGVKWVEIGHGYGLGAERSMSPMPATIRECLNKPLGLSLQDVKVGAFINPNIGAPEDIERARDEGISFIRIGFIGTKSPLNIYEAIPFLERAKKCGLWVSLNAIRAFSIESTSLAQSARIAQESGVDCFYLVDSTGGALPNQVAATIDTIKTVFSGTIGFHGHNNLGLAIANSFIAARHGATFLDGTLRGVGRDAGNTAIETLALVLRKAGFHTSVDPYYLLHASSRFEQVDFPIEERSKHMLLGEFDILTHGYDIMHELCAGDKKQIRNVARKFYNSRCEFENMEVFSELANSGAS